MDLSPCDLSPRDLSAVVSPAGVRPICDAGVDLPPSTSLKWGQDGELTALDLHNVLARLCLHDPQACRALDDGDSALP